MFISGLPLSTFNPSMRGIIAILLAFTVALPIVARADIVGRASVIDGDTIEITGKRIRLFGIDAPEGKQSCNRGGKTWRCGQRAAFALANLLAQSPVNCLRRDKDRYQRLVAVCYLNKLDVNGWMVQQGWALDYKQYSGGRYSKEELEAQRAKRGIWAGEFTKPWEWRRAQSSQEVSPRDLRPEEHGSQGADCRIKGNVSSRGERIYHVPGGAFYSRTRIDTSKGERWFCSESEARAAGWRRSKR
jgi:endonuclease YncB( thermonuclease family)